MKESIKQLKKTIDTYHKLIEKMEETGKYPEKQMEKICEDGDIVSKCFELSKSIEGCVVFEGKGYSSCGYDLNTYVFSWYDGEKVDGLVLDVENF